MGSPTVGSSPQDADAFQAYVSGALEGPLVVLLERDRADHADDGRLVREDSLKQGHTPISFPAKVVRVPISGCVNPFRTLTYIRDGYTRRSRAATYAGGLSCPHRPRPPEASRLRHHVGYKRASRPIQSD
jgi:hypothetical protein